MSRAIGQRHFYVTQVPFRNGWALCEQTSNFFLFSKSKCELYRVRAILLKIYYRENETKKKGGFCVEK